MRLILIPCLLFALPAWAADYSFSGYARDIETGRLLYVETHEVRTAADGGQQRSVLYRQDEQSPPFARKILTYGADRPRPDFEFSDERSGFAESVARAGDVFEV